MKIKSLFSLILLALIFATNTNLSFAQGAMPLLSGKVFNIDGKIITGGNLKFLSNGEQKAKAKINSDGTYSIPVPSNANLTVILENHIVSKETSLINTPKDYAEFSFDIKVTPIVEGMLVGENIAFEPNSKVLTTSGKDELNKLVKFATENIKVYYKVKISNKDSYFADKKEKKTTLDGKKKKTITETIKAETQSQLFADERIAVIQEYVLSQTPRKNFFIFEAEPTYSKTKIKPSKPTKKGKSSVSNNTNNNSNNNLVITVDKVR